MHVVSSIALLLLDRSPATNSIIKSSDQSERMLIINIMAWEMTDSPTKRKRKNRRFNKRLFPYNTALLWILSIRSFALRFYLPFWFRRNRRGMTLGIWRCHNMILELSGGMHFSLVSSSTITSWTNLKES